MKYSVGDLVLIKDCVYKPRLRLRLHLRLHPRHHPLLHPRHKLFNSYGMVTQAIKHSDVWEGDSTSDDNGYVWFSQIDGKEYCFYENEVTGEIIK